jgi:hypothetical protein
VLGDVIMSKSSDKSDGADLSGAPANKFDEFKKHMKEFVEATPEEHAK